MGNLTDVLQLIHYILIVSNPNVYGTLSLYEAVTLLMVIAGLCYTHFGIIQAKLRLDQLRKDGRNGILKLTADENLRIERNRRNELLCIFLVALFAAVIPPRASTDFSWVGSIVSLLLMLWTWLLSKSAYMSGRYRDAMARELAEIEERAKKRDRRKEDYHNEN
jgi:hypothetical protein